MRHLAIVLALAASPAAALTGSGTVEFNFTQFRGPFALGYSSVNVYDPANWLRFGSVNGAIPYASGFAPENPGRNLVLGYAPLTGTSVDFHYADGLFFINNNVTFTPAAFTNVAQGVDFNLGRIDFTNGTWLGGTGSGLSNQPVYLDFTLTTRSVAAAFNQVLSGSIKVVVNDPSPNDCGTRAGQEAQADFLTVVSSGNLTSDLGALRVYDGTCAPAGATNQGSIHLVGQFNSLHLSTLAYAGGSGFYTASSAFGPAAPSSPQPFVQGIPEPATWSLLIAGFGMTGAALRRQRLTLPSERTCR